MVELNDYEITPEDRLYVSYAQDKATRRRTLKSKHMKFKNETNLYIKSLKPDMDEEKVKVVFEKYGKVTSVCLKVHEPKPNADSPPTDIPEKPPVKLKFGFINFMTAEEAKNAFTECKKDTAVLSCIDQTLNSRGGEFIYYAQTKTVRQQYLRMQKKNLKTFKLIQDNVLQYYQLMKYFMPQNFRNNQRGPSQNQRGGSNNYNAAPQRGGFNKNYNSGSNRGGGNYKARGGASGGFGGRDSGYGGNQFGNQGNMNNAGGMGNTPAPTGNTPAPTGNTPAPNMMFNQNMQFGGMSGMPDMNNMQAFQQQMMAGGMPGMGAQNNNQVMGMQQPMNMQMGGNNNQAQPAVIRDLDWLKNNLAMFEAMEVQEKKNILGNLMYPLVEQNVQNPEHVPKITGMLIDLEVLRAGEIVEIMENQEALKDRIDEAIGIINETE